jgi:hypothetical protein
MEKKMTELEKQLAEVEAEIAEADSERGLLLLHTLEHEATGAGRVIDAEKARSTPCKCFEYEGETFAWSPGVLGLISSRKNPEQFKEFCALGCLPAREGIKERFGRIRGAIGRAKKAYEREGGGPAKWWEKVGEELKEAKVEI